MNWNLRKCGWSLGLTGAGLVILATVCVRGGFAGRAEVLQNEQKSRVFAEIVKLAFLTLHPVVSDGARRARDENYRFVTNLLHECGMVQEFPRLSDGMPFLFGSMSSCEGAYKDIPYLVTMDDESVHGSAVFPVAKIGSSNVVEFVMLANRIVEGGSFRYGGDVGLVVYTRSVPVSVIRREGRKALGMAMGFPALEVDLFSEAYEAVIKGRLSPQEAVKIVGQKLKKIRNDESMGTMEVVR